MSLLTGFVTRREAGLESPRSVSYNIRPGHGGCAVHYAGPAQKVRNHRDCLARWTGYQRYHKHTLGWSDLAYSGGFCNHGYAFAGRGFGVRTAANGTNDGNNRFYAYCWIGGAGEEPTGKARDALVWWVKEARKAGDAGDEVLPHSAFKSTSCPGPLKSDIAVIKHRASQPAPKEWTMTPDIVVYARRGVDYDIASSICNARGGRIVPLLDASLAQEAVNEGVKTYAFGGGSSSDISGEVEVIGADALDTLVKGGQQV